MLLANARYPRKRVQRHASDKPLHQGHQNVLRTYVRTFTGDTDYNPQPQRVIQEVPREIRVSTPLPLDPPDIVVLPATDRIIDCELQTATFRAAGGGLDPNAALFITGVTTCVQTQMQSIPFCCRPVTAITIA